MGREDSYTGLEIAVIGMAGRFPGAPDIEAFWNNLKEAVEATAFFCEEELREAGVDEQLLGHPDYVRANGLLEGIDRFDYPLFGYTPNEAAVMDPQMRLFHQAVWTVLEDAGYDPGTYDGLIGLFAGASENLKWQALSVLSGGSQEIEAFDAFNLNSKDYLSQRISYKLNLTGPSLTIHTACSTSLVAIHLACQSLLTGECDMAMAGGVTATRFQKAGYLYKEGMIHSPQAHCRAFDARAKGIIGGDGLGVVMLKRLEEAMEQHDHLYAVVRGSAVNNDGIRKVGFSASSVAGQAEVIRLALQSTETEPESIGYVETHGTGTVLGDPVEIEALKLAFNTDKRQYCPIGSVKTNVGHLDSAAGVVGFIKAVLSLKHRLIPPSLHFETPNPGIDFENSPFYVNTRLQEWRQDGRPLRAAVSSFGIGGTNAHIILEEAPAAAGRAEAVDTARPAHLIVLSARTQEALERMTTNLALYFSKHPDTDMADAAFTLQVGRRHLDCRRMWVCGSVSEAAGMLTRAAAGETSTFQVKEGKNPVVFLFPGQGSQYVNMGRGLYEREPLFRQEMDRCFAILKSLTDCDLKEILYPDPQPGHPAREGINRTENAQPLLFVFEYALARLLMRWGISPYAMMGHSIGEYTAACLSGVFSLKDALNVVALRGRLMQQLAEGAMLSVPLCEEELIPLLEGDLSLAAVNGPDRCVVSGKSPDIDALDRRLKAKGVDTRQLHTSHAFHSPMMEPILKEYEGKLQKIEFHRPELPFLSNVSGHWITVQEAMSPSYWAAHLRRTVRFEAGVRTLLQKGSRAFVEAGPGNALSTFVTQHPERQDSVFCVNLVPHPQQRESAAGDVEHLLKRVGQLWLGGVSIDWPGLYGSAKPGRISLPTYSFDGHSFPVSANINQLLRQWQPRQQSLPKNADIGEWFYTTSWEEAPLDETAAEGETTRRRWLLFVGEHAFGRDLEGFLKEKGQEVMTVEPGPSFDRPAAGVYVVNPAADRDYDRLLTELKQAERVPDRIIHCWLVDDTAGDLLRVDELDEALERGLHSLLYLAQAIGRQGIKTDIHLEVLTNGLHRIDAEDPIRPEKAAILGPVKIIPVEYPNIHCRSLDIELPAAGSPQARQVQARLWTEFETPSAHILTAYRRDCRLVQSYRPLRLPEADEERLPFKSGGVYLIIGGFGGMGFTMADYLANAYTARLALVGRSPFPAEEDWEVWLRNHDQQDAMAQKVRRLQVSRQAGAEIMIFSADVADYDRMKEVIRQVTAAYGRIDGVIHAAGVIDFGGVIQKRTRQVTDKYIAAKIKGTLILEELLRDMRLDFLALFSSIGNVIFKRKFGQVSYNAANEFLDAFAAYKSRQGKILTVAIEWDDWLEVGMTVNAVRMDYPNARDADYEAMIPGGITPSEGVEVFRRVMANRQPLVIIMTRNLHDVLERLDEDMANRTSGELSVTAQPRPALSSAYTSPQNQVEQTLAEVWQEFFGILRVGVEDDFFELGGDSLKALTLVNRLRERLSGEISLSDIMAYPTIRQLARNIGGEDSPDHLECVVKLNRGKNGRNIFFIHPMHGLVYQYRDLAKLLEDDYNVFGIQARGVVRRSKFPPSFDILVADYLYQIRQVQPEGPYLIGGYCFGDIVAYNMVRLMERLGLAVEKLIMLDEPPLIPGRCLTVYRFLERWRHRSSNHSLLRKYEEIVAEIRKSDENLRDDIPISPHESEQLKRNADTHINAMYQRYLKVSPYKKLPGIIRAPILDIKAVDSKFRIDYKSVKKMSFGKVSLVETGGDHVTMLEKPHVEKVAAILRENIS